MEHSSKEKKIVKVLGAIFIVAAIAIEIWTMANIFARLQANSWQIYVPDVFLAMGSVSLLIHAIVFFVNEKSKWVWRMYILDGVFLALWRILPAIC